MNKNYLLTAYAIAVVFICTGVGYKLGYSAKPPNVNVYVKYTDNVKKSLAKSLEQSGINADQTQIERLGKILKASDKHAR